MSLCLATTAVALQLAAQAFTLSWMHSVERTEWQEHWRVDGTALVLDEARVRGSGAGMDPGEGAVLRDGWWVWPGRGLAVSELNLAVSGATVSGWTFCAVGQGCHDLASWLQRTSEPPRLVRIGGEARGACRRLSAGGPGPARSAPAAPGSTAPAPGPGTRR